MQFFVNNCAKDTTHGSSRKSTKSPHHRQMNPEMNVVVRDLKQLADVRQQLAESMLRESASAREKAELIESMTGLHQQQVAALEAKVASLEAEVVELKQDNADALSVFSQIKGKFKVLSTDVGALTAGLRKRVRSSVVAAPAPAPQPSLVVSSFVAPDFEAPHHHSIPATDPAFVAAVVNAAANAAAAAAASNFPQQDDLSQQNEQAFNELNQPNNTNGTKKRKLRHSVTNGVE